MDRREELIARCEAVVNAPKGELPTPLIAHASDCALLLSALRGMQEWIPVVERLPERDTDVLVFAGWIDVATFEPKNKRIASQQWFSEPAGINPFFSITHWSALPKPPGGVE